MSTTVCKFGGSSLSDAGMFRRAAGIIRSDASRRFIILSAPGRNSVHSEKITDLLYRAHSATPEAAPYIFSQIAARYTQIRDALCPGFDIEMELSQIFSRIKTSPAYTASRGEYLCAKLFSAFSGIPFVDAAELIRFYDDGSLDMQSSCECIKSRLSMQDRAVIPGFYGSLPCGEICTFTRGGSDVSGAVIAAALDAELYENWTDVDGLFTADPNLVPDARRNFQVSINEMERIAAAGAKLLHTDSLSILRGTGIETRIKNTFDPGADGTSISEAHTDPVKCVTGRRNLSPSDLKSMTGVTVNPKEAGDLPLALISVFGLEAEASPRLERMLNPFRIIHMQDHIQIITPNSRYETAICAIHALLTD